MAYGASVADQWRRGATYVDKLRDDEPPGPANSAEHTYLGMMKSDMQVIVGSLGGDPSIFEPLDPSDTFTR